MNAEEAESIASKVAKRPPDVDPVDVAVKRFLGYIEKASRKGKYETWGYCDNAIFLKVAWKLEELGYGWRSNVGFFDRWIKIYW